MLNRLNNPMSSVVLKLNHAKHKEIKMNYIAYFYSLSVDLGELFLQIN